MSRKNQIEVIARAIMMNEDNILLCRMRDAKWYFLPGGHVEFGEFAEKALVRELNEEANITGVKVGNLAGIIENKFPIDEQLHHEINMFFDVELKEDLSFENQESHILYEYISLDKIDDVKILPMSIKEKIMDFKSSQKTFFNTVGN